MKLERLSSNTVKFSISIDELETKGILKDDQWRDSLVWHEFFEELMDEMYSEYGIDLESTVTVEINSVNSSEMVLILTLDEEGFEDDPFVDGEAEEDGYLLYKFHLFEDILSFVRRLEFDDCEELSLYSKDGIYFIEAKQWSKRLVSLAGEYGERTSETIYTVKEYGNIIIDRTCRDVLIEHFGG
ncbi:adaptor protein MecA [Bacillus sp. SG-1]|uniref:adaptor protein MecA n=1 Tax=Bacillus sp. SG-1 TaxID=161544 RepID=UPI0001544AFD|nr:adaptor protein MecA [Bacillus sp. SG-1]EDL63619.1 adaptor protein [Bacillus sp. SG-1]